MNLSNKVLTALLFFCGSNLSFAQEAPTGFEKLFNGEDLSGWYAIETQSPRSFNELPADQRQEAIDEARASTGEYWRVENGEIVNDGEGPYLTTDRQFRDFELLIEYKTVARADSGIYLKATPQVQIWDYTDESKFRIGADKGSGGLWNNSAGAPGKDPLAKADNPFGEWNKFRILQVGSRTSIWLNGQLVVDHAIMENRHWGKTNGLPLINQGPIQLQTHGGEIRWRNIFVRELDVEEANAYLANKNDDGFESIFNGTNLDHWKGPITNYEVSEGIVKCLPGKGGTIYHERELDDFVARLEFRLPPGGNNGLAIRYPGSGNTAYVGMCELQVLDSEHPKYANLDARQYHGSAYGMVPAHRGYLRDNNQWNFQEVTVKGSTIKVELNGTLILNTDLSQVTEFMSETQQNTGKNRTSGFFGLAGHNDPVEYRRLRIKPLK